MRVLLCLIFSLFLINIFSQIVNPEPTKDAKSPDEYSRRPSEDFIKQWENIMGDFTPEDIKTFMVHGYESDVVKKIIDMLINCL
jgi:hypothetical protein